MTGAALDPELGALDPEIRMQILRYRLPVRPEDLARLAGVRPTVRRWAAAARPNSVWEAGRLLAALVGANLPGVHGLVRLAGTAMSEAAGARPSPNQTPDQRGGPATGGTSAQFEKGSR